LSQRTHAIARTASAEEKYPPPSWSAWRSQGGLILLVDDEPDLLEGLKLRLEVGGYRVLTADNGLTALEVLAETRPDLIISDIMMPVMDGFDFFQAVRSDSRWLEVPFIFLSGSDTKEDVRYGKLLGAEEYVVKPFDPEELQVAIARAYVELHGGRIEVVSEEDVGSTFSVWLPLCSPQANPESQRVSCGQVSTQEYETTADSNTSVV